MKRFRTPKLQIGPMAKIGNYEIQQTPRTELARILLALADPIRLRMLNLMFARALAPEQFAQLLEIDEKSVFKHLVLFRESKIVAWHTRNNIKYYTVRNSAECPHFQLLLLAIELLKDDLALHADLAILNHSQAEVLQSRPDEKIHPPKCVDPRNPLEIAS